MELSMSDIFEALGSLLEVVAHTGRRGAAVLFVILGIIVCLVTWSLNRDVITATIVICVLLQLPEIYRFIKSWIV